MVDSYCHESVYLGRYIIFIGQYSSRFLIVLEQIILSYQSRVWSKKLSEMFEPLLFENY